MIGVRVAWLRNLSWAGNDNRYDLRTTTSRSRVPPQQRCTVASVAGHSMYERETPYFEHALGGTLDMSAAITSSTTRARRRITGARWIPAKELRVKIEGAKKSVSAIWGSWGLRDRTSCVTSKPQSNVQKPRRQRFGSEQYEPTSTSSAENGVLKSSSRFRRRKRTSWASSSKGSRERRARGEDHRLRGPDVLSCAHSRRQGHGRNGGDDEEDDEVVTGLYVERQSHGSHRRSDGALPCTYDAGGTMKDSQR